jgi:hypothetical protein
MDILIGFLPKNIFFFSAIHFVNQFLYQKRMSSKRKYASERNNNGSSSNGNANLEDFDQPSSSAKMARYIENLVSINGLNAHM